MTSDPRVGLFISAAEAVSDFRAATEASNSTYIKLAKCPKSRNYQESIFRLRPMTGDPRVGLFFAAAEAFGNFWAAAEASNSTYVKFAKSGKVTK